MTNYPKHHLAITSCGLPGSACRLSQGGNRPCSQRVPHKLHPCVLTLAPGGRITEHPPLSCHAPRKCRPAPNVLEGPGGEAGEGGQRADVVSSRCVVGRERQGCLSQGGVERWRPGAGVKGPCGLPECLHAIQQHSKAWQVSMQKNVDTCMLRGGARRGRGGGGGSNLAPRLHSHQQQRQGWYVDIEGKVRHWSYLQGRRDGAQGQV